MGRDRECLSEQIATLEAVRTRFTIPCYRRNRLVEVETESRGRVTIPVHVRERFGDRYEEGSDQAAE